MSDAILTLTDEEFESKVIKSKKPVLVDYWAEWCGPCKMIAPILEEVADEMSDKILIGKLNVDENSQTPPKYGIRGIPTLMLFKDGNVVGTKVGALSKADLIKFIEDNI
ncbi:thioredoxin TrxA [Gammaproteobacteria bacterium]|jgi:thioredoxin 1|nr:thioredoxin TrxA [Gammaproteobacteria bacterium]MBT7523852.1 thioredoxin TrxA [Gammaproteobacteria bacterium]MBT7814359.1 thioredoxin TrxA [Gammaproteobacteria bacterium]MDA9896914.1 thioredoxin TrxA [Gammaproteobacteria bacterium]